MHVIDHPPKIIKTSQSFGLMGIILIQDGKAYQPDMLDMSNW
jgi:hypothetical protein